MRDGISVLRLPLWVGRGSAGERMRQEGSYTAALIGSLPFLGSCDVMLVTSPSFPALSAAIANARARRLRWVLWLHDLLPDGAVAAGILAERSLTVRASRKLERAAYRSADRIVVLSQRAADVLSSKGVPREKVKPIYPAATRGLPPEVDEAEPPDATPRILYMGNIGRTQGLARLIAAFERSDRMKELDARLTIAGGGVGAEETARQVRSDRVQMLGVVDDSRLEKELRTASMALVSQNYEGTEFNIPSKLMNFMAYGLPVMAVVNPAFEVARIVREAGAGWVIDSSDPDRFPNAVADAHAEPSELSRRGRAARLYAEQHFSPNAFADSFEAILSPLAGVSRT